MIGGLIDLFEPVRWTAYKALTKGECGIEQYGKCFVYGGRDFLDGARRASELLQKLDLDLWSKILDTEFFLIEESKNGSYQRTSVKKFSVYKYVLEGGDSQLACHWATCLFMAREIDGWNLSQRMMRRAPLVESVYQSLEWIKRGHLEGAVSNQLQKYLGQEEEGDEFESTP